MQHWSAWSVQLWIYMLQADLSCTTICTECAKQPKLGKEASSIALTMLLLLSRIITWASMDQHSSSQAIWLVASQCILHCACHPVNALVEQQIFFETSRPASDIGGETDVVHAFLQFSLNYSLYSLSNVRYHHLGMLLPTRNAVFWSKHMYERFK